MDVTMRQDMDGVTLSRNMSDHQKLAIVVDARSFFVEV
jgi:hypothetical protein